MPNTDDQMNAHSLKTIILLHTVYELYIYSNLVKTVDSDKWEELWKWLLIFDLKQ